MNVLVILAHPNPASFNHAIAQGVAQRLRANGHRVVFHDLYEEGFESVLPAWEIPKNGNVDPTIDRYCRELAEADGVVIVHPNWWGQPPAILKGWIDRVIRPGVAYEFREGDGGEGVPIGLLKAKAVLVFNTSNTAPERERLVFGDPLETIWKNCIFDLCGVRNFYRKVFTIVVTSAPQQRQTWLEEAQNAVSHYFPLASTKG